MIQVDALIMGALELLSRARGMSSRVYFRLLVLEDMGRVSSEAWPEVRKAFGPLIFWVLEKQRGVRFPEKIQWNQGRQRYELAPLRTDADIPRLEKRKKMARGSLDDLAAITPQIAFQIASRLLSGVSQISSAKLAPASQLAERVLEYLDDRVLQAAEVNRQHYDEGLGYSLKSLNDIKVNTTTTTTGENDGNDIDE